MVDKVFWNKEWEKSPMYKELAARLDPDTAKWAFIQFAFILRCVAHDEDPDQEEIAKELLLERKHKRGGRK